MVVRVQRFDFEGAVFEGAVFEGALELLGVSFVEEGGLGREGAAVLDGLSARSLAGRDGGGDERGFCGAAG